MKIISLNTKEIYEFCPTKSGENTTQCPECSHDRKKKNAKSFSWNEDKKTGYCHHCNTSFVEFKPFTKRKEYKLPIHKNITELSEKAVKYFESRMISQKTLNKMKLYTDREYMPQFNKEVETICFPYYYENNLINIKFRGVEKSFKFTKDSELIFYNLDCVKNSETIIIVEGEIDALSLIEIGFDNVLSVPNGGGVKNMEFLDNYIQLFDNKKIILATDNDLVGIQLRDELLRRFGNENCLIVDFKEYKDANEVLTSKGGLYLRQLIETARECEVSGIIKLNNYFDDIYSLYINGLQPGLGIGIKEFDELCTWESGRLAVWTGIPSHGKSEALDFFNIRINILHGWKIAYFSPENYPIKYHYSKIASKISGKQFKAGEFNQIEFELLFDYISDNFFFINPEDNFKVEIILDKAKFLIKKYGIKVLCIDPYNKLEHSREKNESETEYISRFLDQLVSFAKKYDILIHLVAHPRKMEKDSTRQKYEIPNLYDINGSANFYNKSDYGICVYRNKIENSTEFAFQKIKFRHLGTGGSLLCRYNYNNGRYENFEKSIDLWDNSSYINFQKTNDIIENKTLVELFNDENLPF